MPESPIVIACACNERYAPGLAVTVLSLMEQKVDVRPVLLYVLADKLGPQTKLALVQSWPQELTVQFLAPSAERFSQCNMRDGVSPAVYFRLLLPECIPYERVLYLDSDLLIIRDIGELWDTDLRGSPLGAVQELGNPTVGDPYGLPGYHELHLPQNQPYINSGVLLMDLTQWRRACLSERVLAFCEHERKNTLYWDQDGLNAILGNQTLLLDPRWNVGLEALQRYCPWKADTKWKQETVALVKDDPWIVHFLLKKPWEQRLEHLYAPLFEEYWERTALSTRKPSSVLMHE